MSDIKLDQGSHWFWWGLLMEKNVVSLNTLLNVDKTRIIVRRNNNDAKSSQKKATVS